MQSACVVLYCNLWPARLYSIFPTLSHINSGIFAGLLRVKHVFISSTVLSEAFLILRRNERDMTEVCNGIHVKYPLRSSDFNET
jgi:hypothetical protein